MIGMRLLSAYRCLKVNVSVVQNHVLLISMVLVNGIILIVGSSNGKRINYAQNERCVGTCVYGCIWISV